jgi:thiamine biosynthesis lipoprotein
MPSIAASPRASQTWKGSSAVLDGRRQTAGVGLTGCNNNLMKERRVDTVHTVAVGRKAMACQFEVIFNIHDNDQATPWGVEALDLIDAVEDRITVYRSDSELALLNARAADDWQSVSDELFSLLVLARDLNDRTLGAFDVTAGPLIRAWGFLQRQGRQPDPGALMAARRCSGMDLVEFDMTARRIRFRQPGVEINLGAIGKGWAIDRAIDRIAEGGIVDVFIHGGHSSLRACGCRGFCHPDGAGEGWPVGLRHPLRPRDRLGSILIQNRALGTSGSGTQFFIDQGRKLGHILDPRTGHPATGVLSATVLAPTAAEADALATAAYVLGPTEIERIAPAGGPVAALLVLPGSRDGQLAVRLANLSPEQFQRTENLPGLTIIPPQTPRTGP